MEKQKKSSVVNFGIAGWGTILYCLLMFFFYVGMVNDGTNVLAPNVAASLLGFSTTDISLMSASEATAFEQMRGMILNLNGIAGMVGVAGFILVGQINRRIGARFTAGIFTIVAGIAYMVCGNAVNLPMYFIGMCFVVTGIMSAGYIAGGTLVATWFPKKKGIVMGYTTMGHNFASAFYCTIFTALAVVFGGVKGGCIPIGISCIILGIIGAIFMRNTPQERHLNPDNVTDEVYKAEYDTDVNEEDGWTIRNLLKTKELWLAAITTGMFQICSVGVMSQLVTRNTRDFGMTQTGALGMMTVIALIGVIGSWLIGVIDDKIGTKKTMKLFGLWYCAALVVNILAGGKVGFLFYLSILMIGMGIGGSANFTTSLPTSIFGRQGFDKVNSVIFPIQGLVTACCFLVNGVVTSVIGNLTVAYIIFAVVAIVNVALVSTVDEHKYNKDWKAAEELEGEKKEKEIVNSPVVE
jgi:OFA family oxalate/formate antiporter-like MFS transporter